MSGRSRHLARLRSRILRQATTGVASRIEALERRCLLASDYGVIQGVAYEDSNDNGQMDANDTVVVGAIVFADADGDGVRDPDEAATTTHDDGSYAIQLRFGSYVLRYQPQEKEGTLEGPEKYEFEITPGETQEHDLLFRRRLDWGDAPDSSAAAGYPTLAVHGGAVHLALKGYSLGNRIDPEPDGQPNATATGDDLAGIGDEDGVTFLPPLTIGSPATVRVDFTSIMGLTGVLDGWMDFNADGDWDDAGERIFNHQVLAPGGNVLSFAVPPGSIPGPTFARFRLSPNGVDLPGGHGISSRTPLHGEVEDYRVRLEGGEQHQLDWGDAPEIDANGNPLYPTRAINNGARHEVRPDFTLGPSIDPETDGQPNADATGDDAANIDDENSVVMLTPMVPGDPATVRVTLNGSGGFLSAWIDFNGDGSWAGAGEQIFNGVPLAPGNNDLNFNVPATAKSGFTFARFRLAQTPSAITTFTGFGGRGEVEDYRLRIDPHQGETGEIDWGDAPNFPGTILQYPTRASHNGARHTVLNGFRLGRENDPEPDGQPTILADGDDVNGLPDDEDGVFFLDPLIPGSPARVQVDMQSPNGLGRLDAWIDWHADGNWNQAIDRVFTSVPLSVGPNILVVNVPANIATGRTYARFRLSFQGNLPADGFGREGEVEDYLIQIKNPTNRKLDWGDAPERNATGAPTAYPTTAAKTGARHALRPGFTLGLRADGEPDGQPTLDALGDDNNGIDDEDGVTFISPLVPGGVAQVRVVAPLGGVLDAWIDFQGNGNWSDAVDRIATTHPLAPGVNVLNVNVPAGSTLGETYARFRLSPNGVVSYDGFGFEGEVEDYRIRIQPRGGDDPQTGPLDWGDAPASYRTLALHDGARHTAAAGFTLGNLIDTEPDGQPSVGANRDDFVGIDDEEGVTLVGGVLVPGSNAQFEVVAPGGGVLDAWIDLNGDGDWADAGEHVFVGVSLAPGLNVRNFIAPDPMPVGDTYARFRLSPNGVPNYFGFGFEGEVEDYVLKVRPPEEPPPNEGLDWGDAPDGTAFPLQYPTLLASDGARHSHIPGFTLGYRWDSEPDGQPSIDALRDDFAGIGDEDGVKFLSPLVPAQMAKIEVFAQNGGILDAWVDWDGDGNWTGANDQIFDDHPLVAGSNLFVVPVPAGLKTDPYRTFSRFRLSREGVADFKGFGGDGEVEDYRVIINGPSISFDPFNGTVHIAGTEVDDEVLVGFDRESEMLQFFLGGPDTEPGVADLILPYLEIREISIALGEGDDHADVDGRDFLIWQRNLGSFDVDGGGGFDTFAFDASGVHQDLNFVIEPNEILMFPRDPVSPAGGIVPCTSPSDFEGLTIQGGMGDDMFLLPAVIDWGDSIREVTLAGGPGDDELSVAMEKLTIVHEGFEVNFDGGPQNLGGPGDALNIFGAGVGGGPHFEYTPAPGMPDAGSIISFNPQPEPPALLNFSGLEPINIASGDVTLTLPAGVNGNDVITIDPLELDSGDSNMISGTSNGSGFEHLVITDVGTFTLDTAANVGASDVVNFNGSIIGAGNFTMPAGLADLALNVNAGAIPIGWDPGALGADVSVDIAGGAEVRFGATQHLVLLTLHGGALASLAEGGNKVLVTDELNILAGASLDLFDNDLVVDFSSVSPVGIWTGSQYDGVTGYIQSGRLNSSTAAAPLTTLGVAEARESLGITGSQTGTFSGEIVDSTAVLVKFTWGGDANLDGKINIDDYGRIDGNVAQSGIVFGWFSGDFNYDGKINIDDYGIIDGNINQQDEIL